MELQGLLNGEGLTVCGIAGIYAYHYAAPDVDRDELRRVRDHMTTRGPDGKGEWVSANCRVALGHRRLSVIDLSERGAQPMASASGKLVVTFNGEIYNYRALRKALEAKGSVFRTHSDTEVLLHLYADKGETMVHDLRGMFAFALWDADKSAMLLVRDPYGIKPLYYADDGWTLRVASQVKASTPTRARRWSTTCAACLPSPCGTRTKAPCSSSGIPMASSRYITLMTVGLSVWPPKSRPC